MSARLDHISTHWPLITDPAAFVLRYAPAIERYLGALLPDANAVDEVRQELFVRVLEKGFAPEQVTRGRFRDYLKVAVRHAALAWFRREKARPAASDLTEFLADDDDGPIRSAERAWVEQWRGCLLERVWDEMDAKQREKPREQLRPRLRLAAEDADATTAAARLTRETGRPVTAEAYRKQLSRARRLFAVCLLQEVTQALGRGTVGEVEDELSDLGLLSDMERLLPEDWREGLSSA